VRSCPIVSKKIGEKRTDQHGKGAKSKEGKKKKSPQQKRVGSNPGEANGFMENATKTQRDRGPGPRKEELWCVLSRENVSRAEAQKEMKETLVLTPQKRKKRKYRRSSMPH